MTDSAFTAVTWRVAQESHEWVGPIIVTATIDNAPVVLEPGQLKFAVVIEGQRPTEADWADPVDDPDDPGNPDRLGVDAVPVDAYARYGIWVRISVGADTYLVVLEPDRVGWIERV